jgi:hypothetical protein
VRSVDERKEDPALRLPAGKKHLNPVSPRARLPEDYLDLALV